MIRFVLGADTKEFDAAKDRVKKDLKQMGADARGLASDFAKWGTAAAAAGAVIAAAVVGNTMKAVTEASNLNYQMGRFNRQSKEAASNAAKFGQNLSKADTNAIRNAAAGVEDMRAMFDGLAKQLTAKFAPVIQHVVSHVKALVDNMGGIGVIADKAFGYVIDSAKFVVNAVDGITRVFKTGADLIIAWWAGIAKFVSEKILYIMEMANKIPGVDMSDSIESVRNFAMTADSVMTSALENIGATWDAELAGGKIDKFVADAQKVVDLSTKRTQTEVNEINKRLNAIAEANKSEIQLLNEKFAMENQAIKDGLAAGLVTQEEAQELNLGAVRRFNEAKLALDQERADKELEIERAKEEARRAIITQAFSGLTSLMNSGSRKMFEIGKASAIGQAIVSTYAGAAKALELGWPMGPIAASAIALNGFNQVAQIRKQSFGGGGGASSAGSVTADVNAGTAPVIQRNISIDVAGESVSRGQLRDLIGAIGGELGDNVSMSMGGVA